MVLEKKGSEQLERATHAIMQRTSVSLNQLKIDLERFCHRDPAALDQENLQGLMKSLIQEGQQVPIEFFVDEKNDKIVIKGSRRTTAMRLLADKNTAGFTHDMQVEAIEVRNATPQDLLVRSIADNEVRLNLDRVSRIRMTKKLHDLGVPDSRAANALNVSVKTLERDLLIARQLWMLQHVIDDSIDHTYAWQLLEAASKVGRMNELKEDLDAWVAEKRRVIREQEKVRKARDGKDLKAAEKKVKSHMDKHLVGHWLSLLEKRQRFDEDAHWTFAASLDDTVGRLKLNSIVLDVNKAPIERIAKVGSKLSLLAKQLGLVLKKRHLKAPGAGAADADQPYDLEYLREIGAEDLAQELERELREPETKVVDPEDDEDEVAQEAEEEVTEAPEEVAKPSDEAASKPSEAPPAEKAPVKAKPPSDKK